MPDLETFLVGRFMVFTLVLVSASTMSMAIRERFRELAVLISDVLMKQKRVIDEVRSLRTRFCELHFCFKEEEYAEVLHRMRDLF